MGSSLKCGYSLNYGLIYFHFFFSFQINEDFLATYHANYGFSTENKDSSSASGAVIESKPPADSRTPGMRQPTNKKESQQADPKQKGEKRKPDAGKQSYFYTSWKSTIFKAGKRGGNFKLFLSILHNKNESILKSLKYSIYITHLLLKTCISTVRMNLLTGRSKCCH